MNDAQPGGIDEGRRRAFESSWIEGRPEAIERHLPTPDRSDYLPTLEELVCIELEFAWKRCAREVAAGRGSFVDAPRIEAYLERFPALDDPEIVARLAAEELRIRRAAGDRPPQSEYRTRFPGLDPATLAGDQDVPGEEAAGPAAATTDDLAGRYVLMAEHARGGMGAVWRASDRKLGREVAVKQLNDALALRGDFRRRFLTEARVTARLEHPGIVPVYDLSEPGADHDYYAMKLVRGETLAAAIDAYHQLERNAPERSLEERRLFDAFLTVCRTMEYAHARGVIHRDLKPQNIVLGNYGETIVLDWGLAKDLGDPQAPAAAPIDAGADASASTAGGDPKATRPGTVQGTPAYMAPEQASGRTDEVDQRTDVYALGVILYQLLTGDLPFFAEKTEELLQLVIGGRLVRPRVLEPDIPRTLEAICLAAMARDRGARYPRVADLTRDLQRHLADEPVSVWTEPWTVQARRWMRRHRTAVTAAVAAVVVAVIGLTVLAFVLTAANRRLEEANARERQARLDEAAQRQEAERNFAVARDAVDRYFTLVSEDTRLRALGMEPLRLRLLRTARQFNTRLAERRSDDPALELERGHATIRLAMITHELGNDDEAIRWLGCAQEIFTALAAQRPDDPFVKLQLARIENRRGGIHTQSGRASEAEKHLTAAVAIVQDLARDKPGMSAADTCEAAALQNLAGVYRGTRRLEKAEETYRRARAVQERRVAAAPKDPWLRHVLATIRLNLAMVTGARGRAEEAVTEAEAALALTEALVREAPNEPVYAAFRAKTQSDLGVCYRRAKRIADAKASYARAAEAREALARKHPDVLRYAYDAAQTRLNLANVILTEGEVDEAVRRMVEVARTAEALVHEAPDNVRYASLLAVAHFNLGAIHAQAKRYQAAEDQFAKAAEVDAKTAARHPAAIEVALRAAEAFVAAGDLAARRKARDVAADRYLGAVRVLEAGSKAASAPPALKAGIDKARARLAGLRAEQESVK